MADVSELDIIQYLAGLGESERGEAFTRINAGITLAAPVDEVDPPAPITTLGEFLDIDYPLPPFLVAGGQVVRGEITALIARAGKGKTTLVRNRMIRWAAGRPLFDELPDSQVPVGPLKILLIENEGVAWDMQMKLESLLTNAGLTDEEKELARKNLMIWGDGGYSGLKLDKDEDYALIRKGVAERRPDVVMMEPFRGLWMGEENDATAMEAVLDSLVKIASEFECAVMLSHHARKAEAGDDGEWMNASRGSNVLEGKVAVMENFREAKGGDFRELKWSKSRYFPPAASIRMQYDLETHRYEYVPWGDLAREIKRLMAQDEMFWWTVEELADETNEEKKLVGTALKELLDSDAILKKSREKGTVYRPKSGSGEKSDDDGKLGMS